MKSNFLSDSGYILVTEFDDYVKDKIDRELREYRRVWFNYDALLLEHIQGIFEESYLSEKNRKYIIIQTNKMGHISQNSLLKLFEEPPKNVHFILIVPSRSIILPTIRSRLPLKIFKNIKHINLDLEIPKIEKFNLNLLNKFLKDVKKLNAVESRIVVEQILKKNSDYKFIEQDFERFSIASQLLNLNSNSVRVFLMLLLPFVNRNR